MEEPVGQTPAQNSTPEPYPGAPHAPEIDGELSDADLDAVTGGREPVMY